MTHLFLAFWSWLMNFLSGPPPREIPCPCDNGYGDPVPSCTQCMATGLIPVSEKVYQKHLRIKKAAKERRSLHEVYLIGCIDLTKNPPVVKEVYIRGDKAQSGTCILNEEFLFDIGSASGYSFEEARKHLIEGVKSMPRHFGWVRDLAIPKGLFD